MICCDCAGSAVNAPSTKAAAVKWRNCMESSSDKIRQSSYNCRGGFRQAMRIRPIAAEHKLSRALYDQLAGEIKSGRLAPGARLPTEEELSRAARVSRTVVREAVAALRAEGLVITRQGVGAFVSAEPQRAPFRIEPEKLRTIADILSVMELRLGVEIESAGLAAERATRCAATSPARWSATASSPRNSKLPLEDPADPFAGGDAALLRRACARRPAQDWRGGFA